MFAVGLRDGVLSWRAGGDQNLPATGLNASRSFRLRFIALFVWAAVYVGFSDVTGAGWRRLIRPTAFAIRRSELVYLCRHSRQRSLMGRFRHAVSFPVGHRRMRRWSVLHELPDLESRFNHRHFVGTACVTSRFSTQQSAFAIIRRFKPVRSTHVGLAGEGDLFTRRAVFAPHRWNQTA